MIHTALYQHQAPYESHLQGYVGSTCCPHALGRSLYRCGRSSQCFPVLPVSLEKLVCEATIWPWPCFICCIGLELSFGNWQSSSLILWSGRLWVITRTPITGCLYKWIIWAPLPLKRLWWIRPLG